MISKSGTLASLLRQPGNPMEAVWELLGIKAIDRRELFFQPALALVYKATVGDDIQVAFAIDGRLSPEHEEAFARANGPKKLGILQSLTAGTPAWTTNDLPSARLETPAKQKELEAAKQAAAKAHADLADAEQLAQQADSEDEKRQAGEKAEAASKRLSEANSALAAIPVRGLDVHEHPALSGSSAQG